jgi:hypothetical protein
VYISQKVSYPLECIRTRQVNTSGQRFAYDLSYTVAQYCRLIRNGTDNATALCTVIIIIQVALVWWCIMRVYPMPLVREAAFGGVRISIGPGCGAAYRAVVLGFEYFCEDGRGLWGEESFCEEAYLHVYCSHVSREPPSTLEYLANAPSVFQHTAGQNSATPYSTYLVSIMMAHSLLDQAARKRYGGQLPGDYPRQRVAGSCIRVLYSWRQAGDNNARTESWADSVGLRSLSYLDPNKGGRKLEASQRGCREGR